MNIIEKLLDIRKWTRPGVKLDRSIEKNVIKCIGYHWTESPKGNATGLIRWYNNQKNKRYGSTHYIIGLDGEIYQIIPEDEMAYQFAVRKIEKPFTNFANYQSISIEHCILDMKGKMTEETISSSIQLCAMLCKKYNLNSINDIMLHSDIVRKKGKYECHWYFWNHREKWENFKRKCIKE